MERHLGVILIEAKGSSKPFFVSGGYGGRIISTQAGYRAHGSWYDLGQGMATINISGWFHGLVLGTTFAIQVAALTITLGKENALSLKE